jgi:hypothetical protein
VTASAASLYLEWREHRGQVPALRDQGGFPAERLLQAIWHHQRLQRDSLRLADGRRLWVLHPGFWNRESGPDFRRAVLQIEGQRPSTGDVEVDLHSRCWHQHGHDRNPAFAQVQLHVVWETDARPQAPTLVIQSCLDAPLPELASWLDTGAAEDFPEDLLGRCASPLAKLPAEKQADLLRQAALARLERKAVDLEARARQAGWAQALWEGLLRALGYKHNAWPMLRLAELRPLLGGGPPPTRLHWQARLFGVSGLLPSEVGPAGGANQYLRQVWDLWWRERDQFADVMLPAGLWRLHGLRPANHPLRRLSLAAAWWVEDALPARLDDWFAASWDDRALADSLGRVLQVPEDEFWSWHWTLRSARFKQAQPLLGPSRLADLAVNVLLPWFWARARRGKNSALQDEAARRYLAWPAAQDNSVLRLARQRLLARENRHGFGSAALQQGLLQIVRDFCDHSDSLCSGCEFPQRLAGWREAIAKVTPPSSESCSPPAPIHP